MQKRLDRDDFTDVLDAREVDTIDVDGVPMTYALPEGVTLAAAGQYFAEARAAGALLPALGDIDVV